MKNDWFVSSIMNGFKLTDRYLMWVDTWTTRPCHSVISSICRVVAVHLGLPRTAQVPGSAAADR